MIFKRKTMATAIMVASVAFSAQQANAIDWSKTPIVVPIYTNSMVIDAKDGRDIFDWADDGPGLELLNVKGVFSEGGIGADINFRVTLTLSNGATFFTTPGFEIDDANNAIPAFTAYRGGAGSDYAVFNGTSGVGTTGHSDYLVDVKDINVLDYEGVELTIVVQSVQGGFPADTYLEESGPLLAFGDSFAVYADLSVKPAEIDVAQKSFFFYDEDGEEGMAYTDLGDIYVKYTSLRDGNSVLIDDETDIIAVDIVSTIEAENGWSAADQEGDGADLGAWLASERLTIDGTTATKTLDMAYLLNGATTAYYGVNPDNEVPIEPTGFTFSFAGTPADKALYHNKQFNVTDVPLNPIVKSGSEARLTFALTPGGAFRNFIRLTNPSGTDGLTTLTLINDAGERSTTIGLGEIAGIDSDIMDAGASTPLIGIDKIYAAVRDNDSDFEHAGGKLRIIVNAEFGRNGEQSGIVIQSMSLSSDNKSFNMMTNVN